MSRTLTLSERVRIEREKEPGVVWKSYLLYDFPDRKKEIASLNYDQKMEWYQTRKPEDMVFLGNSKEFQRFWKWHVLIPLKIKRFLYRLKNGELFKHYPHITEMKNKVKRHSI